MNVVPAEALVQPRAVTRHSSDALPLVDLVSNMLDSNVKTVRLVGRGKTTALSHLAAHFDDLNDVRFLDDVSEVNNKNAWRLTVYCSGYRLRKDVELKITPWTQDDVIEYLIGKSPERCKSVMSRIAESSDLCLANGCPTVLSTILDLMVESDNSLSVEEAIHEAFETIPVSNKQRMKLTYFCSKHVFESGNAKVVFGKMCPHVLTRNWVRFLSNQPVRYVIGAERVASKLRRRKKPVSLSQKWPKAFVEMVSEKICSSKSANEFLNSLANRKNSSYSSTAASLLVEQDPSWRPKIETKLILRKGHLEGVNWNQITLRKCFLENVNLSNAFLQSANFEGAMISDANFSKARLTNARMSRVYATRSQFSGADMRNVTAPKASFSMACFEEADMQYGDYEQASFSQANLDFANLAYSNLSSANLSGANLKQTNFSYANLTEATASHTDFRSCDLTKTIFKKADLIGSTFSSMRLADMEFEGADFKKSLFTYSRFRDCCMSNCNLQFAKMAEIIWENCDLTNANFEGVHFFMGSTRCGNVDSPYPSHGTRTGFYTDDYNDHHFKRPEEIRKACFRGCDLRGAFVENTDFYLVDLRDAKYDEEQEQHFRRCGAILED